MRIKRLSYISLGILVIILVIAVCMIESIQIPELNAAEINDLAKTIDEGSDQETIDQLKKDYGLNYYYKDGRLIIVSDIKNGLQDTKSYALIIVVQVCIVAIILIIINLLYFRKYIIGPFNKLQNFAGAVARGNLDAPLLMDRKNIFGDFTESFDIMREELAIAKENEKKANESKKELVASLSHDIKTPLASIKAMTELLLVKEQDADTSNKLHSIDQKTDQIEVLVNNLFHATLEELEMLTVKKEEFSSLEILTLLKNADNNNRIEESQMTGCLVICDPLRLQQVFDNIISNSYKYSDTEIEVSSSIEYGYLSIYIEDYGKGVSKEDLALVKQKYYRGRNSEGKNGAGIGLYISNYFMEQMDGFLKVVNGEHGFKVIIGLRIV